MACCLGCRAATIDRWCGGLAADACVGRIYAPFGRNCGTINMAGDYHRRQTSTLFQLSIGRLCATRRDSQPRLSPSPQASHRMLGEQMDACAIMLGTHCHSIQPWGYHSQHQGRLKHCESLPPIYRPTAQDAEDTEVGTRLLSACARRSGQWLSDYCLIRLTRKHGLQ